LSRKPGIKDRGRTKERRSVAVFLVDWRTGLKVERRIRLDRRVVCGCRRYEDRRSGQVGESHG